MKGAPSWIPFIGEKKKFLKAIIVYPNKRVKMKNIEGDNPTFTISDGQIKRTYTIDPKAIYFFDNQPLLFFNSSTSSPFLITPKDISLTMDSSEFQSIIESKAVSELLEASKGTGMDLHFIASIVSAVGVILLLLTSGGLSFLNFGGG